MTATTVDNHDLEKLLTQCKSNDVDTKIDAVTKLQQAFQAGAQLTDADGFVSALKTCLRSSNQHLSAATLTTLPPFFQLLAVGKLDDSDEPVDALKLRHALTAFLPSGGLLDRLGDNRERSREKARESMVILGGLAIRCGSSLHMSGSSRFRDTGKGPETPLMIWERFLREGGLQSKVWRVREQAILTLVQARGLNPMLPLKPYLPILVELLEDTDGAVRECARQSVVELFTGPTVTDAARADLKKEMTKKNVRKTIVDSVLQKLMAGGTRPTSSAGSHTQDAALSEASEPVTKKEYIPPSLKLQSRQATMSTSQSMLSKSTSKSASIADSTSRPASRIGENPMTVTTESGDLSAVYIASVKDLENEFTGMLKYFEGRETEHNWASRERSINRVRGMLKGVVHVRYADTFLACLKGGFIDASFKTLISLRTTVAINTCHFYSELAIELGSAIDIFCEAILTHLIGMASMTKKIVAIQTQQTVETIVTHTSPHPKLFLNLVWSAVQDKNIQARQYGISHLKMFLEVHGQRIKYAIEGSAPQDVLEKTIKKALGDNNPGVRESARVTFWVFDSLWKERAEVIMSSLDTTARKQLEKACPKPGRVTVPVTPQVKKSSVATAIAASRAKAKAIANAPPTLRHQATSTSQILQRSISPSPIPIARAATTPKDSLYGIRRPSGSRPQSPLSPPARRSTSFSPSMSSPGFSPIAPAHTRTRSIEAPASPTTGHKRFASQLSPPASPSGRSTRDTLAKTTLPPSPRRSLDGPIVLPASPTRQGRSRISSPTRIPSPTRLSLPGRRSDGIASIISFANNPKNLKGVDESLLLAQSIPLPDDTDSEDDSHMMSFSTPFEKYHISIPKTTASSLSAGSPPASAPEPIVEDALRARAEQAESAAERLLELNEIDDDNVISPIPPSLLPSNGTANGSHSVTTSKSKSNDVPPTTPVNRRTALLRQAAMFKDSPANKKPSSLVDVLHERKHETGWWLKRIALVDKGSPMKGSDQDTQRRELNQCIFALEDGTADVATLKKLALLCFDNPAPNEPSEISISNSFPSSPTPAKGKLAKLQAEEALWRKDKLFDRMFDALQKFLTPDKSGEELEYGLIVLWQILESQTSMVEGREAEVFTHLLQIRFCNNINILEATNTIRDALVARIDSLYGLTTLHASLRAFHAEPLADPERQDEKSTSYAFGLIALGKFILRLPGEILEDELPRLKATLTTALSDSTSLVVRESAAICIIAAQLVLRDETALFTLLDGLPDEKKNLLTYLFDKHGARSSKEAVGSEKLEKEMMRLDGRTSTPPRSK